MSAAASTSSDWFDWTRAGSWQQMEQPLSNGTYQVDQQDEEGRTALAIACEEGHEELVKELLARGAKLDLADSNGDTPLIHAADSGRAEIIRMLFEHAERTDADLDINLQDTLGDTALIKASRSLEDECVQLLLNYTEQRCDMDIMNEAGENALLAATGTGTKDALPILKVLLTHGTGAKVNRMNKQTGLTPLLLALTQETPEWELVQLLATFKGVDVNLADFEGNTPLHICVQNELPMQYLKLFLTPPCQADQARQNKKGYTALHLAVRDQNMEMVELMIQHAPTGAASTPAAPASASSSTSPGATPSASLPNVLDGEFGWTILQHACSKNLSSIVKAWGEKRLDVSGKDKRGSTALHLAARFGFLTCVKYLVKFSARVDESDLSGATPLHDAAQAGHGEVVSFLLGKGATLGKVDARGNNVLHKVLSKQPPLKNALDIIKLILDSPTAGELIHGVNHEQDTPWMIADRQGMKDVCALFHTTVVKNPPFTPIILEAQPSEDGSILVTFKGSENDRFMAAGSTGKKATTEWKYVVTATPINTAAAGGANDHGEQSEEKEKKIVKQKKDADSEEKKSTTTAAASKKSTSSSSTTASSTKSTTTGKTGSIKKSSASSSSSAATPGVKKSTSSSSKSSKSPSLVHTATGTSSPLRITGLTNGLRYCVSIVSVNSVGSSKPSPPYPPPASSGESKGLLVGTPSAPTITNIVTQGNWVQVHFMYGGGGSSNVGGGGSTTSEDSSDADIAQQQENKAAVLDFTLFASVQSNNPRGSSNSSAARSSAGTGGGPIFKSQTCVSSPVTLTLQEGVSYTLAMKSRNGYGESAGLSTGKVVTVGTQPQQSSSSQSRPSTAVGSRSPSTGGNLIPLSSSLDAPEIQEATSMLHGMLSSELAGLVASCSSGGSFASSLSIQRVENSFLKSSHEQVVSFMQSIGCSRSLATRVEYGVVCLSQTQAAHVAKHGLQPFSSPLSHAFVSGSTPETSYNANQYPAGSPFAGCALSTAVSRKLLLSSASSNGPIHRLMLCRILPGRSRSVPAGSIPPPPTALFDSSRCGSEVVVNAPGQVLPLYFVEFNLPLSAATSTSHTRTSSLTQLQSEADAALEADAAAQVLDDDVARPSAPIRQPSVAGGLQKNKFMGSAPASSFEPPGELPAGETAARDLPGSSTVGGSTRAASSLGDDDGDIEEVERLDINKATSSALGPATVPKRKPAPAAASSSTKPSTAAAGAGSKKK